MAPQRPTRTILIVLTLLSSLILASTLPEYHDHSKHTKRADVRSNCTTDLSRDLYGLGVRLGIYFQWCSGWVANTFLPTEIAGSLDANAIFMFALLIAMVRSTSTNDLTQLDAHILLQLCSGTILTVFSTWGYRTCVYRREGVSAIRHFGGFGTHLRVLLGAAVGWYAAWFYGVGVRGLPDGLGAFGTQQLESCGLRQVVVFGRELPDLRWGLFAVSLVWTVYTVPMIVLSVFGAVTRVRKLLAGSDRTSKLRLATGASQKTLEILSYGLTGLNFVLIWLLIALVEVSLNENDALGVLGTKVSYFGQILTPAQLIPMLIGTFSFVRITYISWVVWRSGGEEVSPSLGREPSKRAGRQRMSLKSVNLFKIFSGVVKDQSSESAHRTTKCGHGQDPLALRMRQFGFWHSFFIAWLPWLSLWYSWPWTNNHVEAIPQEDEIQLRQQDSEGIDPSLEIHWGQARSEEYSFARRERSDSSLSMTGEIATLSGKI